MRREVTNRPFDHEIKEACRILKDDGTVLYPSDTLWGLGCDAENEEAVANLNSSKKRPDDKNMIVLVSSERMLQKVVKDFPSVVWDILDNSTEATTVIYPSASERFKHLSHENGSIAVRLVTKGFAHDLIAYYNKPITSTSANISGESTPVHLEEINEVIIDLANYVFPEECALEISGKASHLISIGMNGNVKILR